MKRILIIYLSALLFSACSDSFLDVPPQSTSTEGNFYKTESHFTQAINNAYSSLRDLYNDRGFAMTEMRSDNTHYTFYSEARGYHSTDKEDIANFTVAIENTNVRDMWKYCYSSIAKANTILGRLEGKTFSEEFTNKTMGQAKFIRAFAYFRLVQFFGGVPLQLTEVTNSENNELARSSVDDVYTQIIADVKDAIAKLEPVTFPASGFADGAATQGAAKMLYAYALMTKPTRDYAEAEKQLSDILKMGYELETEFADVFEPAKKNGKEHIFSIQYQQGDQGQQSKWLYIMMPRTNNGDVITGIAGTKTVEDAGWNVPTDVMVNMFADDDKRRNVSVGIAVSNNTEESNMLKKVENWYFAKDPEIDNYAVAIPFIRKYHHAHTKLNNTDDNWPVYRYADALLLLAECLVAQGKAGEAAQYLNRVRTRAGLKEFTGTVTADVVAAERKLELAFENHRWFDLLRTGKALEVMTEHGKYIKEKFGNEIPTNSYNIKEGYLVYPIPYLEMQRNKLLTQNEGYVN